MGLRLKLGLGLRLGDARLERGGGLLLLRGDN